MFQHSAKTLLYTYRILKADPGTAYRVPWDCWDTWTWTKFQEWFMDCLHAKINRDDKRVGRKLTAEYQSDLLIDRRTIENYLYRRQRSSGSRGMLRTKEMQDRYPFINNQPRED